ncbi:hypothetical protein ACQPXH_03190 [Nocardia sp. CA-135953]|uniref:hypothetical protein n=1 Tax=Nocardia sp. CA-135953 TaxID=3239978 RepID=UPI003D95FB65
MSRWRCSDPAVAQVRNLTSTLTVPSPWDRSAFLRQVTMLLGKRIRLLPLPATMTTGLPYGLVLDRVEDVVIAYDAWTLVAAGPRSTPLRGLPRVGGRGKGGRRRGVGGCYRDTVGGRGRRCGNRRTHRTRQMLGTSPSHIAAHHTSQIGHQPVPMVAETVVGGPIIDRPADDGEN